MHSEDNSSHANAPSGDMIRLDDYVVEALLVTDEGNGCDIDGIFKYNKEMNGLPESFREKLRDEVEKLASQGRIEKIGNRYKMPDGVPATSASTEESSSASLVPTASASEATTVNMIDAAAKQVAEAEDLELQAKEAHELADKHTRLLNLESHIILQLAEEILNRCANGHKIFLRDDPSSVAMDSEDSSSHANASSGEQPSYSAAMDSEDNSSDAKVSSSDDPSSSSVAMVSSDPSSEENIPYVEQLQRRDIIDSAGSSEDDTGPSGFTSDELIFKALETVYDDGNSMDIDEIFKCVQGRYEILEDFREKLEDKLGDLVSEGQVEKVGNRYRIPHGLFDTPTPMQSEKTQSMSSGDSKPQDIPSTSSSSVPTAPQENPKIDAAAKQVAEAEDLEFQAKEAHQLADKHTQLLNLESHIILQLAVEILNRCANGHKIFLR